MKALSVKQPWAWALIHGPKRVENRTWATRYRGPLLIHAGKKHDPDGMHDPTLLAFGVQRQAFSYGALLGVVMLDDCVPVQRAPPTPFTDGPWCWIVSEPTAFAEPIPWAGRLQLFDVPDHIIAASLPR